MIHEIGQTDADGLLVAERQPEGDFTLAADFAGRMFGDMGLDLRAAVDVRGDPGSVLPDLRIQLPVTPERLAVIEGIVRDADGAGIPGCQVVVGERRATTTERDGTYRLEALDPGAAQVVFFAIGCRKGTQSVSLREGETTRCDTALPWAVTGAQTLAGHVLDDDGRPVPGVAVYLDASELRYHRTKHTDAAGAFRFSRLDDGPAGTQVSVVATGIPGDERWLWARQELPVPADNVVLRVRRTVEVVVRVVSGGKSTPIPQTRITAVLETPGAEPEEVGVFAVYAEDGRTTLHLPRGRVRLTVEGRGHAGVVGFVQVSDLDGPKEVEIALAAE
jgi:hypothetical protein